MPAAAVPIQRFDFPPGRTVAGKYVIERRSAAAGRARFTPSSSGRPASAGRRSSTTRTATRMGKAAITYARKLDALRHCPILMQYHHQEIATSSARR